MKADDERRAEERGHLKVALATVALQLDAFEMRTQEALHAVRELITEKSPVNSGPGYPRDRRPEKDGLLGGQ